MSEESSNQSDSVLDRDQQQIAAYQTGQSYFEHGRYREAVDCFKQASELGERNSRIGGEIQMWLVTAYEAAGQREDALTLCRQLHNHPYGETRKQSKRLLYILEAPKLELRPEWLTQIPELEAERDRTSRITPRPAPKPPPTKRAIQTDPVDLNQVDTQDNGFIWLALAISVVVLSILIWPG